MSPNNVAEGLTPEARKDLAQAYQVMLDLAAWKHFEKNILDRIEEQATKDEDNVPMEEMSMVKIAECRGRRKAIDKIKGDVEFIIYGLK